MEDLDEFCEDPVNHMNDENYEENYGPKPRPSGRARLCVARRQGGGLLVEGRNPVSILKEEDMARIKRVYGLPTMSWADIPCTSHRPDWDIRFAVPLYEIAFEIGLRLPLPTFVEEVLGYYGIAPGQLMPNAWRIILALQALSEREKIPISIDTLRHSYHPKRHDKDGYRFQLCLKAGLAPLVVLRSKWNDRSSWKRKYFTVFSHYVFGTSVWGKVPSYWCRFGSYPGGDIPNTAIEGILKIPEERRRVDELLSPQSLSQTSIWWTAIMETGGCADSYAEMVEDECRDSDSLLKGFGKKRKESPFDSAMPAVTKSVATPTCSVRKTFGTMSTPSIAPGGSMVKLLKGGPTVDFGWLTSCHGRKFRVDNLESERVCKSEAHCFTSHAIDTALQALQIACASHQSVKSMQEELRDLRKKNAEMGSLSQRVEDLEEEVNVTKQSLAEAKGEVVRLEAKVQKVKASGEHRVILTKREFAVNAIAGKESDPEDYQRVIKQCEEYLKHYNVPIPARPVASQAMHRDDSGSASSRGRQVS